MLDPEYVKRIESEMEESGGQLAPDDHEGVWANLKACHQWAAELEFAIALLTDMRLEEVQELTLNEAAERHPTLSREAALKAEIRTRDSLRRAVETRNLRDQCARMQRDPATLIDLFGDEEDLVDQQQEENETARLAERDSAGEGEVTLHRALGERARSRKPPSRGDLLWKASQLAPKRIVTAKLLRAHCYIAADGEEPPVVWQTIPHAFDGGAVRLLAPAEQSREIRLLSLDMILADVRRNGFLLQEVPGSASAADVLDSCARFEPARFYQIDAWMPDPKPPVDPAGARLHRDWAYHLAEPEMTVMIHPDVYHADCVCLLERIREEEESFDWGEWPHGDPEEDDDDEDL